MRPEGTIKYQSQQFKTRIWSRHHKSKLKRTKLSKEKREKKTVQLRMHNKVQEGTLAQDTWGYSKEVQESTRGMVRHSETGRRRAQRSEVQETTGGDRESRTRRLQRSDKQEDTAKQEIAEYSKSKNRRLDRNKKRKSKAKRGQWPATKQETREQPGDRYESRPNDQPC